MKTSLPFNRIFIAALGAFLVFFCVMALASSIAGSANTSTTFCVAPEGDPDASGQCWDDPLDLTTALRLAQPGDEVWIQQGRYSPGTDEHSSFYLPDGVGVYGGFSGNPDEPDQRDPNPANTVLDGEDRNFTVVIAAGIQDTTLNGVTVQSGSATLIDNEAIDVQRRGGGIFVSNASVTFQNLIIANNRARFGGGGVYVDEGSTTVFRNIILQGNSTTHPQSGRGGGMRIRSGEATLFDVTVRSNDAVRGGGLFVDGGTISIENSLFADNTAQGGGGISVYSGSLEVDNTRLAFNEALEEGGGLYVSRAGNSVWLDRVDLIGNSAGESGGGALLQSSSVDIDRSVISGNQAETGSGGGLALTHTSASITSTSIRGNQSLLGGAVASHNADTRLVNSLIAGNAAATPEDTSRPARSSGDEEVRESMISDPWRMVITGELFPSDYLLDDVDFPPENAGGAILITGEGSMRIVNCTIAGNRGGALGAAIYRVGENSAEVVNSIISHNLPLSEEISAENGSLIFSDIEQDATTRLRIDRSIVQGECPLLHGVVCWNVIDEDPRFLEPVKPTDAPTQSGNFDLWFTSPAIDAADPAFLTPAIVQDVYGSDRYSRYLPEPADPRLGSTLDIGAVEVQPPTLTPQRDVAFEFQEGSMVVLVDVASTRLGQLTGSIEVETEDWQFESVVLGRLYSPDYRTLALDGEAVMSDGSLRGFRIDAEMNQLQSGVRQFRINLDTGESTTWQQVQANGN